jgi:hypothetical protein
MTRKIRRLPIIAGRARTTRRRPAEAMLASCPPIACCELDGQVNGALRTVTRVRRHSACGREVLRGIR